MALVGCIFYGYLFYWSIQRHRAGDIQKLAVVEDFYKTDIGLIRQSVDQEVRKLELVGLDHDLAVLSAVKYWVSDNIRYDSDLRNYGMPEYFANAKEVYDRGVDDCDGIAVLSAAILKMCDEPKAKVSLTRVHAEVVLPGVAEPVTKLPKVEPFYKRFEFIINALVAVPWLRCAIGLLIFGTLCEFGARFVSRGYGRFAAAALGFLCVGLVLMELFTRRYLLHPSIESLYPAEWCLFFGAILAGLIGIAVWTIGRLRS